MKRLLAIASLAVFLGAGCAPSSWPATDTQAEPQAAPPAEAENNAPAATATTTPEAPPAPKPAAKKPAPKPVYAYITITDTGFFPAGATIKAGTTVVWTNKTQGSHSVESENNLIHSGNIAPGKSFSHTYTSVGSYPFYDGSHTEFKGTIYVK